MGEERGLVGLGFKVGYLGFGIFLVFISCGLVFFEIFIVFFMGFNGEGRDSGRVGEYWEGREFWGGREFWRSGEY